jgi:signal transduction histidine kinase
MVVKKEHPDGHKVHCASVGPTGHPTSAIVGARRRWPCPLATIATVPYRRIDDPEKLRRLLDAVLMIEADVDLATLLRHLVEEACALVDARYGALGVLNEARTALEQFLTVGLSEDEERRIGPRPTGRGVLGLLITEPQSLRLDDLQAHPDSYGFPAAHPPMTTFLGLPVRVRGEVYGNLYLTDKRGSGAFNEEDEARAEALAVAAGIAIENTRLNDRVRILSVLDDRDRIARDLHDRVIQRIFAVGMALQAASRLPGPPEILDRVDKAVDDLDTTINEIRTAIFELGDGTGQRGLRHSVLELIDELTPMLGARPEVTFHGPVDSGISQKVADHLLAVLREALTNAGKHAGASRYAVVLTVGDDIRLEIADDGSGIELPQARSKGIGLVNLASRAEKLGGTFEIQAETTGGTRVLWSVPA